MCTPTSPPRGRGSSCQSSVGPSSQSSPTPQPSTSYRTLSATPPNVSPGMAKAAPTSLTASTSDALDLGPMSRPAIALPPEPRNEPVKDYAPGSPEREELQKRLRELERDRIEIP